MIETLLGSLILSVFFAAIYGLARSSFFRGSSFLKNFDAEFQKRERR